MSKKLKPLTIFLSDDELINFKSHFDEFLNMNCDDKIKEQQEEIERLNNIIKEVREYIMTNGIHSDYGDKGIDDENKLLAILDKADKGE